MDARRSDPPRGPGDLERLAELSRVAPSALALFSEDGAVLAQNDAARLAFGAATLPELFASPDRAQELVVAARDREHLTGEAELATVSGRVWFLVHVRRARDPVTGRGAIALSADDLTERRSADRAKDEFISIVNHELRTPLTAIRGAVGLLANDVVTDPSGRAELFDIAWDNVQRLGRLVDDLLDAQRLRLGAVDLVLATMELSPLAEETLDLLRPRAAEAGVDLRLDDRAPGVMIQADPGRLVQALANLVTNAIKHSPPGGDVTVEIVASDGGCDRLSGSCVRVYVRDRGPGVPAEFVSKLFAPFMQADSTDARSAGGAGLGLYIVRTLIEAHGGTVGYDPTHEGGAAFYFDLPATTRSGPDTSRRRRARRDTF